ncbi:MAG: lysostaphin resistance A-like protein [Bryobacteraceae bacterium]
MSSIPPIANVPSEPPRPRSLSERIFLGGDGRVRPIFRALTFGTAAWLAISLVGSLTAQFTEGASLWLRLLAQAATLLCALLLLSWFFVRVADGTPFSALGLSFRAGWARQLALGAAVGTALMMLGGGALLATRAAHYSLRADLGIEIWMRLAANAALFALAASVEELAFRGYALQRLMESVGKPAAVAATSLIFGFSHLGNPAAGSFSTANTILAGVLLSMPYLRTLSMWMQIGVHWSWNFVMAAVVSVPVSGLNFQPSLFSVVRTGPDWFTGGPYGPEGGALVTFLCLAGIAWLWRTSLLTPSPQAREALE